MDYAFVYTIFLEGAINLVKLSNRWINRVNATSKVETTCCGYVYIREWFLRGK